ncbi:MAG: methyltransferase domain-containing protein [Planctomycetes bacterium]|nr:methyltransferase domain-containing protein [Planctomycetota bacterium]
MKEEFKFTEYTKNNYLNAKSKMWSYFNKLRLKRIEKILLKYDNNFQRILEFGSLDLYFATNIIKILNTKNCEKYTFTDLYDPELNVLELAENNMSILQKRYKIEFNIVCSTGEDIHNKVKEIYDSIFIFETLEHVQDEQKVIDNMNKLSKQGGLVFVTAPQEFGMMFFFKELGRLLIVGKTQHKPKEVFYATFGKMNKVKTVIGSHIGYDYRKTITLFQNSGFELLYKHNYPNRVLSYGAVLVFRKV